MPVVLFFCPVNLLCRARDLTRVFKPTTVAIVAPCETLGDGLQRPGDSRREYHRILAGVRVEVSEDPSEEDQKIIK